MTLEATACKLMWLLAFAEENDIEPLFYDPVAHDII